MAKLLKKAYEHQIPFASSSSSPYHGFKNKRPNRQRNYIDKKDEKDTLRQTGLQNPTPAPRPPHRSASQETPP
jgi:hypothetical protein